MRATLATLTYNDCLWQMIWFHVILVTTVLVGIGANYHAAHTPKTARPYEIVQYVLKSKKFVHQVLFFFFFFSDMELGLFS
jgi:hypothetical protein